MNDQATRPTLAVVLAALRSSDERAHASAVEWLARYGDDPIRRLVLEATDTRHPVEYRLRVLRAIGRIGSGTDPNGLNELWTLLRDEHAEVRSAAARLLDPLSGRVDKEVKEPAGPSAAPGGRSGRHHDTPAGSKSRSAATGAGRPRPGGPTTTR